MIITLPAAKQPIRTIVFFFDEKYAKYFEERLPFYAQIMRENNGELQTKVDAHPWKSILASALAGIVPGKWKRRLQPAKENRRRLRLLRHRLCAGGFLLLAFLLAGCGAAGREVPPSQAGTGELPPVSVVSLTVGQKVHFSKDSGIWAEAVLPVTITAPEGCTVAYTTNGALPTAEHDSGMQTVEVTLECGGSGYLIEHREHMMYPEVPNSRLLDDPSLPAGKVLRAAAVSPSGEIGEAETRVYFPGVDLTASFPECLVVSIVTDPANLLDYETGILTPGALYDVWKQTEEASGLLERGEYWEIGSNINQHGKAWERPCFFQIYDGGNTPAVELNAGIRVTGHASRVANQKSFNLYFRDSYGASSLEYPLFGNISRYKSLRLRSGGNNADWMKFKDAFLQELVSDRRFMVAAARPAVLFLNGEYWGPYLLTEKVSAHMLRDHCGVDKDQVILFKEGELEEGTEEDVRLYEELMSYAEKDLTDPGVWQSFCGIMDIGSMADYCAARIYFGDADWRPDKNDVLWRTRDESFNGGRWQYVLYDVEFSSGLYGDERTAPETDHFRLAQENYPLFAAAIRNPEFYTLFLDALREIGSVNCAPEKVERLLAEYLDVWEPLMPDYYKRFGDTRDLWNAAVKQTTDFFRDRYDLLLPAVEAAAPDNPARE